MIGPYQRYDPQKVHNSLTAGTLRGPGKLAIPPMVFAKTDESEAIGTSSLHSRSTPRTILMHVLAVVHLGRALCGHDGIIHGGLLATIFDESCARNALLNLPSHIGVTANLNINYKSPCMADQVGRRCSQSIIVVFLERKGLALMKSVCNCQNKAC
jgi:hypothetical protein